jgi:hypothetical protein
VLSSSSSMASAVVTGKTAVATPSEMEVELRATNELLSDSEEIAEMQVGLPP